MALISLFIALALITLPGLAWVLLTKPINLEVLHIRINSWRLFMLITAIPNIITALLIYILPESPKYLYHRGKSEQALQILRRIYRINTNKPECSFPVKSLKEKMEALPETGNLLSDQIFPLFKPPNLKYVLAGCFIQGGIFAVSSGLLLWYPDIINQLAHLTENTTSSTVCQALSKSHVEIKNQGPCSGDLDQAIFVQNLIIGAVYLVSYAVWGAVVNFVGNRNFFSKYY